MRKPSISEATAFLAALEQIRAPCMPSRSPEHDASPPMSDLACLIREADLVTDVETHLLTVCRMALRDVGMRCHMKWWVPQDFGKPEAYGWKSRSGDVLRQWKWLTDGERGMMGSDVHPAYAIVDIEWECDRRDMPTEVWLTGGEISAQIARGFDGRTAIDAAFCARHPTPTTCYFMTSAAAISSDEGGD